MQVLKFGGTSVANAENIAKVITIVKKAMKTDRTILVCSAIGGCTDSLVEIGERASRGDDTYKTMIDCLQSRHNEIIRKMIPSGEAIKAECDTLFDSLRGIAMGVSLVRELTDATLSTILSYGELLSTRIIDAKFASEGITARWVDSRSIVKMKGGAVDTATTYKAVSELVSSDKDTRLFILPGFIASDEHGHTATIGRGGSDYSAALFAAGAGADHLEIWTDVPGMMTADPKVVSDAFTIKHISYRAALELSHFGAKVIYPPTIQPVVTSNIPVYIKNTFNPEAEGTVIEANPPKEHPSDPIGICNSDGIALISLEGSGMVGIPGFSARLFAALSDCGINIILITQASSVHTMCIAIAEKDAATAKIAADQCFAYEISLGKLKPLKVETGYSIVCLVGDNVIMQRSATGRMLATIGRHGIPVRAVAQGSSERNVSVIVQSDQVNGVLKYLHDEFFTHPNIKVVDLYIAGLGTIGKTIVRMVGENADAIAARTGKRIRICGVSNSRKFLIDKRGIDPFKVFDLIEGGSDASNEAYFDALYDNDGENSVFVDCTASEKVCTKYAYLVENRYSIVACNKIFFSSDYKEYKAVKEAAVAAGKCVKYETTVGAALPILETIARCVNGGDTIYKVEAVLSGTLNYLCSNYCGGDFDALVEDARLKGYTEPNPADDLSGKDVIRKAVILSREAGIVLNLEDVDIEPFPVDRVKELYEKAKSEGKRIRYVATLAQGKVSARLTAVGPDNPLYHLIGTDNAAIITTADYPSPLVVQGAGAGPRQTVGGILNDILSI